MTDTYGGPFGGYSDVTEVLTAKSVSQMDANITALLALIPDPSDTTPTSAATPDFDQIPPHTAEKLRAEILALQDAYQANPGT